MDDRSIEDRISDAIADLDGAIRRGQYTEYLINELSIHYKISPSVVLLRYERALGAISDRVNFFKEKSLSDELWEGFWQQAYIAPFINKSDLVEIYRTYLKDEFGRDLGCIDEQVLLSRFEKFVKKEEFEWQKSLSRMRDGVRARVNEYKKAHFGPKDGLEQ